MKVMPKLYALAACALLTAAASFTIAADECEPSKWGADDEIGAANLVTPERVRAAAALVREGRSLPLGIVIDADMPAFAPRGLSLQVVQPNQQGGRRLTEFGYEAVYNDDLAQIWLGIGSQIDGLGHLAEGGLYYNCNDEKDFASLDVMAVGADTWGLDVVPAPEGGKVFYGHVILLRDHGIYILETMDTGALVREGVNEFMFVLGQARVRGTVQMIINPVAMW